MDRAMVFTKSGYGFSGYLSEILIGIDDDTLVLSSVKQTEKIPISDLSKVIILPRNQTENYFLAGALAGTYAATLFFGQTDQQPSGFLTEDFSKGVAVMLTTALGVGVGGGIGGLISAGSNNDLVLDFNRIESEKRAARMKLYDLLSNESKFRKIHFSVQGGHVYARVSEEFKKNTGHDNSYGFVGRGSEFNLLRKMQLTYSVEPDIEVGAAIQWSSEPSVSEYSFTSNYTYDSIYNQYNYSSSSTVYEQSFQVTGYYGIGKYKPFYSKLPRLIDIAVGGGIGIANIEYKRGVNSSP
ncbi:MAG: hypothetical protein Q8L88_00185, partial [Bacteroidota bacterium]|nr:hypothetical protein [Bacteroidota bacterium]